jgi:hypothetical protein
MTADLSTLYFTDNTSSVIYDLEKGTCLTQNTITDYLAGHQYADISGVLVGSDVKQLQDNLFTDCVNLASIVINNTDHLTYIGSHLFTDVSTNGFYRFYSQAATATTYYYTPTIDRLRHLLLDVKPLWITDLSYTHYTVFGIINTDVEKIQYANISTYTFVPIDISYSDFHSLFFKNNTYFSLSPSTPTITTANKTRYTVINNQALQVYPTNNLSIDPTDLSFNLYSTVINHYQYSIPIQCWSVESTMDLNKQLSKLKTIYDVMYYSSCNKICNPCCATNTKLTLDELFAIFEAQGVQMATDNSYNTGLGVPIYAKGLPIDALTETYIAVLNLYMRSTNANVKDISLRMPYNINFSSSMPTSAGDTTNYRYNP